MQLIKEQINVPQLLSVDGEAEERRNDLIQASQVSIQVTNAAEQGVAVTNAREIRTYIKAVEDTRLELARPLIDAQKLLKSLADDHVDPLKDEIARVERLVTQYQRAEADRVERERQAQIRAYEEAEAKRVAAEEAAQKAAEKVNTQGQLDRAIVKEQAAQEAAQAVQAVLSAPVPTVNKAKGASLRKVLKWEVTDIYALVKARPDLCKIEAKGSAIQSTCVPEMPNLPPGLRLWWEDATCFRTY
jgi:hypothetical protein